MFSTLRRMPLGFAAMVLFFTAQSTVQAQSLPNISSPPAARQITTGIDNSNLRRLTGNPQPSAKTNDDLGRVPDSLPQDHILMLLKRSPEREQALQQFMKEQYDPQSPNFHKWLTPDQFGSLFGPSTDDINQVTQWLGQRGFTVNHVAAGRTFIDFSGTAGQVAAAFHTEIHHYRHRGEEHSANASDPMIPAALASVVSGFRALNNYHPKPVVRSPGIARFDRATGKWSRVSSSPHLTEGQGANAVYIVGPQDFGQIYGINQIWQQSVNTPSGPQKLTGAEETIGVVGDVDLLMSDIQSFRDQFGVTALGPNGSVVVDHPPSSVCASPDPAFNNGEGPLDAEWSGATAPDATIDFVTCGDVGVTSGTDLAAAYIVQDPAHAQKVSVLSSSYGFCEQDPVSESNQFYVQLWQQAAAEGITVVVATGDSGGAECDEPFTVTYVSRGLGVNAEASTPYNIAAGGTDFSDVFSGTTANYWSPTNGPNFSSAKSYIPEMTWNDSCASPLVLQAYNLTFGTNFDSSSGPNGFCTYASEQPPDPLLVPFFWRFAGSGGLSAVSPKPAWQTGVEGIPAGNTRALPDISMFAASGYTWGHSLILCDSGFLPAGQSCDFSNPDVVFAETDGGTSFVAPAFSGIMALIDQKAGGRQGQANNILYPLAGEQYINSSSTTQPNLATCAAYLGPGVLPACYFHDISGTPNPNPATEQQTPFLIGTTSVPCTGSATQAGVYTDTSADPASNWENCYGYQITVTSSQGVNTTTPNYYGALSTADNADSPVWAATPGYDLATGLGSPNVAALVNAPQWSSGGVATTVSLTPQNSAITPTQTLQLVAQVTAQSGGHAVRGGNVTFFSGNNPLGQTALSCGGRGRATLNVTGAAFGPVGVYNDVYAVYAGGAAQCGPNRVYFGATSASVTVTVIQAAATITGSPVYPAAECCFFAQPYPFDVSVAGNAGSAPTGTVQVQFNGQTIGSGALTPGSSATSTATVLLNSAGLAIGNNAVSLLYSGDLNYAAASGAATVAIRDPSVPFGTVRVNRTSEINVDYAFVQAGAITLNFNPGGAPSTDFSNGSRGSCRSGVQEPAGYLCTIGIAFTPSQAGVRHGAVEVTFQGSTSSYSFYLFPNGVGGAAQIALSAETQVTLSSSLNQPQGVALDPAGNALYVSNSAAAQIVTLPPAGGPLTPFSTGNVSLVYPTDLTFDALGNLLVGDSGFALFANGTPGQVIEISPAGSAQPLSTGSIALSIPTAVREDGGGNLYIADGGLGQLIKAPMQGAPPSVVEATGLNLSFPQALALDNAQQNIYVADGDTNQVLEVPLTGDGSATPVNIAPCDASIANCSLNGPSGIAFDLNGDMYVVDAGNFRVLMVPSTHTSNGTPTTTVPLTGLLNPSNIVLDGSGNLYVPDVANGSLFKLVVASGSVNFAGKTGVSIPVTVTNIGNENLRITRLTFAQGQNSNFRETDNCTRVTISPGGACTINITSRSPSSTPDVLSIQSNAVAMGAISVSEGSSTTAVRAARR